MKRIKINGKVQTKFELCFMMGYWHGMPWSILCDTFHYAYIASRFKEFAREKGISYEN